MYNNYHDLQVISYIITKEEFIQIIISYYKNLIRNGSNLILLSLTRALFAFRLNNSLQNYAKKINFFKPFTDFDFDLTSGISNYLNNTGSQNCL